MASSPTFADARVLKAATVQLRGSDPLTLTVAERVAQAEQAAYRSGFEEGFTAGAIDTGTELVELGERLRRSLCEQLTAHARTTRDNREEDARRLAELALAVAEWAVRRELTSVPEAFFGRLAEVLAGRDRQDRIEITTSPALAEPTRRWLADPDVTVTAADDLQDGEARVALGDTTVFATFTDAFERARALLDGLDEGAAPADHADDVVEVLDDALQEASP